MTKNITNLDLKCAGWMILVYLSVENPDTLLNVECLEANSVKRNSDGSIDPPGLSLVEGGLKNKENQICIII